MLDMFDFGDSASLAWGLVLGAIGTGYFMYGKRMQKVLPMGCGVVLVALPYFVTGTLVLAVVGGLVCALPYLSRFV
ncbi:MAG: hypothetical protein H6825_00955 [Planctomycetes bacterium]|nr:hypothetical protein [Planctomycetota bacterium]